MHHANNAVIMQTEQLGQIEALEEELQSSKVKMIEIEQKMMEQDRVIAQLVGDNLDHLQDNMRLTAHINSSNERLSQMEHRLGQVGSVVMGFLEGRLESLMEEEREEGETSSSSLLEVGTSGASGDGLDNQGGDEVNEVGGVSPRESMRQDSLMPPMEGLIALMERDAEEAGLGGWFNGNLEDVPESWSGANSDASASQDRVRTTLLTVIVMTFGTSYGTDLYFFELFELVFLHPFIFGIDHDPHVFYVHMTYVYFHFFYVFFLHTITWPREVTIVL